MGFQTVIACLQQVKPLRPFELKDIIFDVQLHPKHHQPALSISVQLLATGLRSVVVCADLCHQCANGDEHGVEGGLKFRAGPDEAESDHAWAGLSGRAG